MDRGTDGSTDVGQRLDAELERLASELSDAGVDADAVSRARKRLRRLVVVPEISGDVGSVLAQAVVAAALLDIAELPISPARADAIGEVASAISPVPRGTRVSVKGSLTGIATGWFQPCAVDGYVQIGVADDEGRQRFVCLSELAD